MQAVLLTSARFLIDGSLCYTSAHAALVSGELSDMAHANPIEDMDELELEIDKAYVQKRVDDWINRLDLLKSSIKAWATQNTWQTTDLAVPMNEELMQSHGIPTHTMPGLTLITPNHAQVSVKPKGLWVIGANGRVDIYSPAGAHVLVDTAAYFEPAKWIFMENEPNG